MQDRTINNALIALYRAGGEQGDIALTLLTLRDAVPAYKQHRCRTAFRRGHMRAAIMDVLRMGPMTSDEVAVHIQCRKPDWTVREATLRVRSVLTKMKARGMVAHDGRRCGLWWLTPEGQPFA